MLSLRGRVSNPYSGVKTAVLVFRTRAADDFKLVANHNTPIDDNLPGVVSAIRDREVPLTGRPSLTHRCTGEIEEQLYGAARRGHGAARWAKSGRPAAVQRRAISVSDCPRTPSIVRKDLMRSRGYNAGTIPYRRR